MSYFAIISEFKGIKTGNLVGLRYSLTDNL